MGSRLKSFIRCASYKYFPGKDLTALSPVTLGLGENWRLPKCRGGGQQKLCSSPPSLLGAECLSLILYSLPLPSLGTLAPDQRHLGGMPQGHTLILK